MATARGARRRALGVVALVLVTSAVVPAQGTTSVGPTGSAVGTATLTSDARSPARSTGPQPAALALVVPSSDALAGHVDHPVAPVPSSGTGPAVGRDAAPVREIDDVVTRVAAGPRPQTFVVAVTGDILPHVPVRRAARRRDGSFDFRPLLRGIRGHIRDADLALCHLEVPLTSDPAAASGYPVFAAPHQLAEALAHAGYDGCSVASNHALDRGVGGVGATLRALDRARLGHAGTARSRRESRRPPVYRVAGRRIAHLSYTYGINGAVLPAHRPWTVNLIDRTRILRDARRAKRRGADLVLVSLHWGTEYVTTPTQAQRRLAGRLLRSPAVDVLIGHHAHVVQPVERRHGKVVAYGLGNLLSNQSAACCRAATQDGVIVRLVVGEHRDGSLRVGDVEYVATMVRHPQRRVVAIRHALRHGAAGRYAARLRASLARTRRAIGDVAEPAG